MIVFSAAQFIRINRFYTSDTTVSGNSLVLLYNKADLKEQSVSS